jgi:methionine synthase I (cobalamin-dependent)
LGLATPIRYGRDMERLDELPEQLLLDGGMGTALMARGLNVGDQPTDEWNIVKPDEVAAIHKAFFDAGAQAVQTNTFGANRLQLRRFGLEESVIAHNIRGAELARRHAPPGAFVIGNLGPTGAIPPPEGDADLVEPEEVFAEQAAALAHGGVDFFHIETLYHPKEARAAIRGCRLGAPGVAVVASTSCRREAGMYVTHMNFPAENLINVFLEEKTEGLGINCSLVPNDLIEIVRYMVEQTDAPVFAKPTIAPDGGAPLYPREFAMGVAALFATGARAVGGCCGTGAADIQAARKHLDEED